MKSRDKVLQRLAGAIVESPGASLERLAEMAETSRGTLYRIARSREELVELLRTYVIDTLNQVMDSADLEAGDPDVVLFELTRGFLEYPTLCAFSTVSAHMMANEVSATDIESSYRSRMGEFFARWQKEGRFRPDLPVEWLVLLYDHATQAASEGIRKGQLATARAADLVYETYLDGIRAQRREVGSVIEGREHRRTAAR